MNKYIFLDIDGVLNSNFFFIERSQSDRWKEAYEKYPQEIAHGVCSIDERTVNRLNRIIKETGAKIVVSSSWRHDPYLQSIFSVVGIEATIFDITPLSQSRIRGEEIQAWLCQHPEPCKYVILDDDCDMLPEQYPYFIQTDCLKWGLDDNDVELAIKILNS